MHCAMIDVKEECMGFQIRGRKSCRNQAEYVTDLYLVEDKGTQLEVVQNFKYL